MRKRRELRVVVLLVCALFFVLELDMAVAKEADPNDVYWYVDGQKVYWELDDNTRYLKVPVTDGTERNTTQILLSNTGLEIRSWKKNSNYDLIELSPNSGARLNSGSINDIPDLIPGASWLPVIHDPESSEQKALIVDNALMVIFHQSPDAQQLTELEEAYGLQLAYRPPSYLPPNGKYAWIFVWDNSTTHTNIINVAADLYEQQNDKLYSVEPSRINLFEDQVNDSNIDDSWHLQRIEKSIDCFPQMGGSLANTQITDVWNMGITGLGVKVAVIDGFGFDFGHPDMAGQFLDGWDCTNANSGGQPLNAGNYINSMSTGQAHGMAVSGIIGAKGNNQLGSAGVSHGAKVVPFLTDFSENSVILALYQAMDPQFDVDIINCSFISDWGSTALREAIKNCTEYGRVRNGDTLGIIIVASHGNKGDSDIQNPTYPSCYEQVISVGASTPKDKRKVNGDGWEMSGGSWGSNFGEHLDVLAPGVCLFSTDLSQQYGYDNYSDYARFGGTSAAAPVVAGVCALILQKFPGLTYEEVLDLIRTNADKVQSGTYNYDSEGHSLEAGYGRINAFRIFGGSPTSTIDPHLGEQIAFNPVNPIAGNFSMNYDISSMDEDVTLQIFDMNGRMVKEMPLYRHENYLQFEWEDDYKGMLLAAFVSKEEILQKAKLIRLW